MEDKNKTEEIIVSEDTVLTEQKETEEKIAAVAEEEATYKEISPLRMVLRRFFRSKLSIVGIVMLVFLLSLIHISEPTRH